MQKYYAGTKSVTIYDPVFFINLIESGAYTPIVTTLKVAKDGAVMYTLQLKDNNKDIDLDVSIGLPEEMSSTIKLSTPQEISDVEPDLEAVWETNDSTSEIFKRDVNRLLDFWLVKIQTACTFGAEPPTIYYPAQSCSLKWPWKTCSNRDYFSKFRRDLSTHVIRFGVGYYSTAKNYVGVTLQLSNYPGKTLHAVELAKLSSRKRKKTEEEDEVKSEPTE